MIVKKFSDIPHGGWFSYYGNLYIKVNSKQYLHYNNIDNLWNSNTLSLSEDIDVELINVEPIKWDYVRKIFSDIKEGETFIYKGDVCMKVDSERAFNKVTKKVLGIDPNAIAL